MLDKHAHDPDMVRLVIFPSTSAPHLRLEKKETLK